MCQSYPSTFNAGGRGNVPQPATPLDATFGGELHLRGYSLDLFGGLAQPGGSLPVTLYWDAAAPPTHDYQMFLHLCRDCALPPLASDDDSPPLHGYAPAGLTTTWQVGDPVHDERAVALPADLPPGATPCCWASTQSAILPNRRACQWRAPRRCWVGRGWCWGKSRSGSRSALTTGSGLGSFMGRFRPARAKTTHKQRNVPLRGIMARSAVADEEVVVLLRSLPNLLGIFRILATPILVWLVLQNTSFGYYGAITMLLLMAASDIADGPLARRLGVVSPLGVFLDTISDKIFVAGALIPMVQVGLISSWIALVVIVRDFAVSGLRSFAAAEGVVISARQWGKQKLVITVVAIVWRLLAAAYLGADAPAFQVPPGDWSGLGLLLAWGFSIWPIPMALMLAWTIFSGAEYFWKAWPLLSGQAGARAKASCGPAAKIIAQVIAHVQVMQHCSSLHRHTTIHRRFGSVCVMEESVWSVHGSARCWASP